MREFKDHFLYGRFIRLMDNMHSEIYGLPRSTPTISYTDSIRISISISPIHSLPPELLLMILYELECPGAVVALMRTSQQLRDVCLEHTPEIVKHFMILLVGQDLYKIGIMAVESRYVVPGNHDSLSSFFRKYVHHQALDRSVYTWPRYCELRSLHKRVVKLKRRAQHWIPIYLGFFGLAGFDVEEESPTEHSRKLRGYYMVGTARNLFNIPSMRDTGQLGVLDLGPWIEKFWGNFSPGERKVATCGVALWLHMNCYEYVFEDANLLRDRIWAARGPPNEDFIAHTSSIGLDALWQFKNGKGRLPWVAHHRERRKLYPGAPAWPGLGPREINSPNTAPYFSEDTNSMNEHAHSWTAENWVSFFGLSEVPGIKFPVLLEMVGSILDVQKLFALRSMHLERPGFWFPFWHPVPVIYELMERSHVF